MTTQPVSILLLQGHTAEYRANARNRDVRMFQSFFFKDILRNFHCSHTDGSKSLFQSFFFKDILRNELVAAHGHPWPRVSILLLQGHTAEYFAIGAELHRSRGFQSFFFKDILRNVALRSAGLSADLSFQSFFFKDILRNFLRLPSGPHSYWVSILLLQGHTAEWLPLPLPVIFLCRFNPSSSRTYCGILSNCFLQLLTLSFNPSSSRTYCGISPQRVLCNS